MTPKRVTRRHPVTNRQEPTRYFLAFEEGFAELIGADLPDDDEHDETESRVREPDTAFEESRVRATDEAVSGSGTEPCPPARTRKSSLTSKLTSKGTGKRAERADRDSIFKSIWKVFPLRPNIPQVEAWEVFEKLDEADIAAVQNGAERYAQWFREEAARKGEAFKDACGFAPYLANWLRGQKWIDANSLPISVTVGTAAADAMAGKVTVNKWRQHELFLACEHVLGRTVPVGKSGSWSFADTVVEAAKKGLGSGAGPP